MSLQKWFETPIYVRELDFDRGPLLAFIRSCRHGRPEAWSHACKTSFFIDQRLNDKPEMAAFNETVSREMAEFARLLGVQMQNYAVSIKDMWFNAYERGHSQESHIHAGSHISGIFVLDGDENGAHTVFESPLADKEMLPFPTSRNHDAVRYAPLPGRLILFRSWLRHSVSSHDSDRERITISWNALLIPRASSRR